MLLLAAPAGAVLPPPPEELVREDLFVVEGRGASAPERPSSIYAVQGADLKSRLTLALTHGRGRSPRTDLWAGYAFDHAVGIGAQELAFELGGESALPAPGGDGRRVVVLLRYGRDGGAPQRVEICSVDRPRGEPGLPVYWLGRAKPDESLALLKSLVPGAKTEKDAVGVARAIGLHGVPDSVLALRDLVRRSPFPAARAVAAGALVRFPAQVGFVAGLVVDPNAHLSVKRAAAEALLLSKEPDAFALLRSAYEKDPGPDVRRVVLEASQKTGKGSEVQSWSRSSRGSGVPPLTAAASSRPRGLPASTK